MLIDLSKSATCAGEILAMSLLAVDEKVFDGVNTSVHDVHLQGVAELAGIAQERFEFAGAGRHALPVLASMSATSGSAISRSRARSAVGDR